MITLNLAIFVLLIALTAFFVGTEFAIVRVRGSRIDQLIEEGNKRAVTAKKVTSNLDEYLSACQLGITVTALGLGWIGEPTVERLLHPLFEQLALSDTVVTLLSFGIAFGFVTYVHVVVGELAPKTLAIQKAEALTLAVATPIRVFYWVMYPFIWTLNGSARLLTRAFGLRPASENEEVHSQEELQLLLSESYKRGEINSAEYKYVNNIFTFDDRIAREVMVPRPDIVALSADQTIEESLPVIRKATFTRYPVMGEDKDHIIGSVHIKELLMDPTSADEAFLQQRLADIAIPIIRVMENTPIYDLMLEMQSRRTQMALLFDEYGGTSGIVTLEDILEEIVGDIKDEFDTAEEKEVVHLGEHHYRLNSNVLLSEVNDLLPIRVEENMDVDTIGGWMYMQHADEVHEGVYVDEQNFRFRVVEVEDGHIHTIEVLPQEQEAS